jgi:hypothetical protein
MARSHLRRLAPSRQHPVRPCRQKQQRRARTRSMGYHPLSIWATCQPLALWSCGPTGKRTEKPAAPRCGYFLSRSSCPSRRRSPRSESWPSRHSLAGEGDHCRSAMSTCPPHDQQPPVRCHRGREGPCCPCRCRTAGLLAVAVVGSSAARRRPRGGRRMHPHCAPCTVRVQWCLVSVVVSVVWAVVVEDWTSTPGRARPHHNLDGSSSSSSSSSSGSCSSCRGRTRRGLRTRSTSFGSVLRAWRQSSAGGVVARSRLTTRRATNGRPARARCRRGRHIDPQQAHRPVEGVPTVVVVGAIGARAPLMPLGWRHHQRRPAA